MKPASALSIAVIAVFAVVALVIVAVYVLPASNGANISTDKPDLLNWFGAVAYGNNTPVGDATVTLHLMTPAGEAYNVTDRTSSDPMFAGSYVFRNVSVPDDVTYAYAGADFGDAGNGVHLYGRSADMEINASRITPGITFLYVPGSTPDGTGNGNSSRVLQGCFGTVVDGSSKPRGNVTVTLHLMTPAGEAATYTTRTLSAGEYPGSFAFDPVPLPDNATYAYVTADSGDAADGVQHTVRSKNCTLDKSRISTGILVLG